MPGRLRLLAERAGWWLLSVGTMITLWELAAALDLVNRVILPPPSVFVTEIQHQKVLGRSKVEVQFQDDKYQPNTAVQACRELGASSFAVVGGGGTDQIQACGRYAELLDGPLVALDGTR